MQNCQRFSLGVLKFSRVHNNNVAAANKPTTAGRKPRNTLSTEWWCMKRINILAMSIIKMSEGSTSAKVAVAEPRMDMGMEKPALAHAV